MNKLVVWESDMGAQDGVNNSIQTRPEAPKKRKEAGWHCLESACLPGCLLPMCPASKGSWSSFRVLPLCETAGRWVFQPLILGFQNCSLEWYGEKTALCHICCWEAPSGGFSVPCCSEQDPQLPICVCGLGDATHHESLRGFPTYGSRAVSPENVGERLGGLLRSSPLGLVPAGSRRAMWPREETMRVWHEGHELHGRCPEGGALNLGRKVGRGHSTGRGHKGRLLCACEMQPRWPPWPSQENFTPCCPTSPGWRVDLPACHVRWASGHRSSCPCSVACAERKSYFSSPGLGFKCGICTGKRTRDGLGRAGDVGLTEVVWPWFSSRRLPRDNALEFRKRLRLAYDQKLSATEWHLKAGHWRRWPREWVQTEVERGPRAEPWRRGGASKGDRVGATRQVEWEPGKGGGDLGAQEGGMNS